LFHELFNLLHGVFLGLRELSAFQLFEIFRSRGREFVDRALLRRLLRGFSANKLDRRLARSSVLDNFFRRWAGLCRRASRRIGSGGRWICGLGTTGVRCLCSGIRGRAIRSGWFFLVALLRGGRLVGRGRSLIHWRAGRRLGLRRWGRSIALGLLPRQISAR